MTIAEKKEYALAQKENIRLAIADKGQTIPESTPFGDYAELIAGINVFDLTYGDNGGMIPLFQIVDGTMAILTEKLSTYQFQDHFHGLKLYSYNGVAGPLSSTSPWEIHEVINQGRMTNVLTEERDVFIPCAFMCDGTACTFRLIGGAIFFGQNFSNLAFEEGITDLKDSVNGNDNCSFSLFSEIYDENWNASSACTCNNIFVPNSVSQIASNLFSGANVQNIFINNSSLNYDLSVYAPWGATSANVYWLL